MATPVDTTAIIMGRTVTPHTHTVRIMHRLRITLPVFTPQDIMDTRIQTIGVDITGHQDTTQATVDIITVGKPSCTNRIA